MSNNVYRIFVGAILLASLYFDAAYIAYLLIGVLIFEGVTNLRLPILLDRMRGRPADAAPAGGFEAERAWRLFVALMLIVAFLLHSQLWFFPWFMGFAILGAGISGVCPVLMMLRLGGCK